MSDPFLTDALAYIAAPAEDVVVVIRHSGGTRGSKLLTGIDKAGFQHARIAKVTKPADKVNLVASLSKRYHRKITQGAIQELVDALGNDVRELASAVGQLCDDIDGTIDEAAVRSYYSGRREATGFAVADAAIEGRTGQAIALARHAIATGSNPVPLIGAIAMKLRQLALVVGARSRGAERELGIAPWIIERSKRELRAWSGEGLSQAILAIAQADADAKGGSRDPQFALERAIVRIGRARKMA
ncbi:DNA polymerase III subunit delta [Arcanobacterium haemolyticum]|nr:DNA polymerase III subunit delta [Arcanobacterium haemolyticum]